MSYFFCIVLSCLLIFLVFLLFPGPSDLSLRCSFIFLRVFHTSVNWWFLTGVWMIVSFHKSSSSSSSSSYYYYNYYYYYYYYYYNKYILLVPLLGTKPVSKFWLNLSQFCLCIFAYKIYILRSYKNFPPLFSHFFAWSYLDMEIIFSKYRMYRFRYDA